MLRTLILALALVAPISVSGVAMAEQFPESVLHAEIRTDTGEVVGRVEAVERDSRGRIVAIESAALEPADAPAARDLVAERRDETRRVVVSENLRREGVSAGTRAR